MQDQGITDLSQRSPRVVLHYWGRRGGGSVFTLLLAEHLRAAQPSVDVVLSLSRENQDLEAFRATDLPILYVDRPKPRTFWRKVWSFSKHLRAHADRLASLKPDAVIMTMNSLFAWPFIHLLQRRGLKVFYVAHDAAPHPGDYAALWQRTTQDLLVKQADRVVVLSKSVAQRMAQRIPAAAGKMSTLSLESVYPTKRKALPHPPSPSEPVRLLFYGRLLPYKGLDRLAEALMPLRSHPGWTLTIAGSGPLEAEVRKMFAGWPQVELELGWISDQRTDELFSSHHLLLCPYTEASQSGVIADALSWAMPSLVMPAGALPEQIGFGTAGLVAETMDAEGFRRALQAVFDKSEHLVELSQGAAELLATRQADEGWTRLINRPISRQNHP